MRILRLPALLAVSATLLMFWLPSCSNKISNPDPQLLLLKADSAAASVQSASYTLLRVHSRDKDTGYIEYNVLVKKTAQDAYGFSYRIDEPGKAYAIYHQGCFMLVNPRDRIAMVPRPSSNPLDFAQTYRHVIDYVIKKEPDVTIGPKTRNLLFLGTDETGGRECYILSKCDTTPEFHITDATYYLDMNSFMIIKYLYEEKDMAGRNIRSDMVLIRDLQLNRPIDDRKLDCEIPSGYKKEVIGM